MDYWTAKQVLGSIFMVYALIMFYGNLKKQRNFDKELNKFDVRSTNEDEIKQLFKQKGYHFDRAEDHVLIFKKHDNNLKFLITLCALLFLTAILIAKFINVSILESVLGILSITIAGILLFYFPMQYILRKIDYRYDLKQRKLKKRLSFK